ncbi:hypothetical protein RvY_08174 [Ramazzottius varieornatus]|uniref:Uncharacterized protein n=1 Tax=Ramazzottius varieornatus TaxID=947166 RepID=A0A1D1VD39_RAMVA|nr:hypothetical protein RvY_08174 [Ramazzottius varieornatus]
MIPATSGLSRNKQHGGMNDTGGNTEGVRLRKQRTFSWTSLARFECKSAMNANDNHVALKTAKAKWMRYSLSCVPCWVPVSSQSQFEDLMVWPCIEASLLTRS